jgi:hypothetical protein
LAVTTIADEGNRTFASVDCVFSTDTEEAIPHPNKSDEVSKDKTNTEKIDREVFITHPSKRKR